jgi:hypothetical protein
LRSPGFPGRRLSSGALFGLWGMSNGGTSTDACIERDRAELLCRLNQTLAQYEKARFSPVPLFREQAVDQAFEAIVLCGRFNKMHPQYAIPSSFPESRRVASPRS